MRKIRFLLVMLAITLWSDTMSAEMSSGSFSASGEVETSTVSKSADEKSGKIVFRAVAPEAGAYTLCFWQCQPKTEDGTLPPYWVELNGNLLKSEAIPSETGWCGLTYPETVFLSKGENEIAIGAEMPCVPNVEFIELTKASGARQSKTLTSTAYRDYVASIAASSFSDNGVSPNYDIGSPVEVPDTLRLPGSSDLINDLTPYNFKHAEIKWFGYSFFTTSYFTKGETVNCTTKGIDGIAHVLEIFSNTNPQRYSWAFYSDSEAKTNASVTIPESGVYFVKLRAFKIGATGLCDLNINNQMLYSSVPVSNMAVKLPFIEKTDTYNLFTTNSTGDPMLYLIYGNTYDGRVYAFNDNYEGTGDFNWGNDSRIIARLFPSDQLKRIFVFSASSYNPVGKCEIYAGFSGNTFDNSFGNQFINLKKDDVLMSAPVSRLYNCFAWAGGISSFFVSPSSILGPDPAFETMVEWFDNYLSYERYPGCTKYTREGATEENSVIDLWYRVMNGTKEPTHLSIRNGSDNNLHGYAWESKLGQNERIFHPRYALEGYENGLQGYGKVSHHYRVIPEESEEHYTLEESIADGRCVIERVVLDAIQEEYLSEKVASVDASAKNTFTQKYNLLCDAYAKSISSDLYQLSDLPEYTQFISYCNSNNEVRYLVYDKVNKGDINILPAFEDLEIKSHPSGDLRLNVIRKANSLVPNDGAGRVIIRTIATNAKQILKNLLDSEISQSQIKRQKRMMKPERESFALVSDGGGIIVDIYIPSTSDVRIDVMNLKGEVISTLTVSENLESGNYRYSGNMPGNGVYLVRSIVNGNVEVKKIVL